MHIKSMTYKAGAAVWGLHVTFKDGTTTFYDIRKMQPKERGKFFADFRYVIDKRFG